jgi:hypothetical protein
LHATALFWNGLMQSHLDWMTPGLNASRHFLETEKNTIPQKTIEENIEDYSDLMREMLLLA